MVTSKIPRANRIQNIFLNLNLWVNVLIMWVVYCYNHVYLL